MFPCLLLFSCTGLTTEGLRQHIKKEIIDEVAQIGGIKVVDFQLVHEEGNYYNGTLTTIEDGERFIYDVAVTYDGSNYKWEIITEETTDVPSSDYYTGSSSNHNKRVSINNEMDFRSYISNRTFKSLSDHLTFKYKNSDMMVYFGDTPIGSIQVINHSTNSDGTVVTFLVYSPHWNNPKRYAFATPDILFDEEGREYRME